jgi:hypothetical protein
MNYVSMNDICPLIISSASVAEVSKEFWGGGGAKALFFLFYSVAKTWEGDGGPPNTYIARPMPARSQHRL